jgi:hypothetical protein
MPRILLKSRSMKTHPTRSPAGRRPALAVALACSALLTLAVPAARAADPISPPAKEWRDYCQAYLKSIEGDAKVSDLDVTYCVGMTKGLLTGLRVGAQIGALSFGSRLAVTHELDPDKVFQMFQSHDPARLIGICAPASLALPDYVKPVLARMGKNPDDGARPIAEVFYEALSEAYPCD